MRTQRENSERTAKWRKENPEKNKASRHAWYLANKEVQKRLSDAWRRLTKYGWTEERYNEKLLEQKQACAICGMVVVLCADHKHVVPPLPRGLLCHRCNVGTGKLQDDPALLRKAAEYIEKYNSE